MGLPELNISPSEQFEIIKRAAENGNVESMKKLAEFYEKGIGTEKELELAVYWRVQAGLSQPESEQ